MVSTKIIFSAVAVAAAVAVGWWLYNPLQPEATQQADGPIVSEMHPASDRVAPIKAAEVVVPELTPVAQRGKLAFESLCATCHGINVAGTDKGPPLIHNLYRPGHHGDAAFSAAAANGVVSHHWQFGNMPPITSGVAEATMQRIVAYIREMQVANGVR